MSEEQKKSTNDSLIEETKEISKSTLLETDSNSARKAKLRILRINNEKKSIQNAFKIGTLDKDEIQLLFKLEEWHLGIRGRQGTIWEGGLYCATISFPEDYPESPPRVRFDNDFEHIYIYSSGDICLDLVNKQGTYKSTVTMINLISELSRFFCEEEPNSRCVNNLYLYGLWLKDKEAYKTNIKSNADKLKTKILQ